MLSPVTTVVARRGPQQIVRPSAYARDERDRFILASSRLSSFDSAGICIKVDRSARLSTRERLGAFLEFHERFACGSCLGARAATSGSRIDSSAFTPEQRKPSAFLQYRRNTRPHVGPHRGSLVLSSPPTFPPRGRVTTLLLFPQKDRPMGILLNLIAFAVLLFLIWQLRDRTLSTRVFAALVAGTVFGIVSTLR